MKRRQFLASTGTAFSAVGLSGCSGTLTGSQTSVFQSIEAKGMNLYISLKPEADIQQINILTPTGELFNKKRIPAGKSNVALGLLQDRGLTIAYAYMVGENTVVAIDTDGNQFEKTIKLYPEISITDVEHLENQGATSYDEEIFDANPLLTIENTGTGPTAIIESAVTGPNVPTPKSLPNGPLQPVRGAVNAGLTPLSNNGFGPEGIVLLGPGSSIQVLTAYHPLAFPASRGFGDSTVSKNEYTSPEKVANNWAGKTITAHSTIVNRIENRAKSTFSVRFQGTVKVVKSFTSSYFYFSDPTINLI